MNADNYRRCKTKAANDAVLLKSDASPAKWTLTATEASHLDTKSLIAKPHVAKTVDLDVSTILAEQIKDLVLETVRSWIRNRNLTGIGTPEIQQKKGLHRYCQDFDRLLIDEEGQLLCYNEPTDKLDDENLRNCLPLSLYLACFRRGNYNEWGGHLGASKSYNNAKPFYYWPGMFDWICALTAVCLTCQNNKPKPKHRNEVPLEEWRNETTPFCTIHIDHNGPLHPPSNRNLHHLLVMHFSFHDGIPSYKHWSSSYYLSRREVDTFFWNSSIYCTRSKYCFHFYRFRKLDKRIGNHSANPNSTLALDKW